MKALGENLFFFLLLRINTRRYLKSKASFLQHIFPNWNSARRALSANGARAPLAAVRSERPSCSLARRAGRLLIHSA